MVLVCIYTCRFQYHKSMMQLSCIYCGSSLSFFTKYIHCIFFILSSVLRSSISVRVHAEILKHRFHGPLHTGVHPQDYCFRSTGELSGSYAALYSANTRQLFIVILFFCLHTWGKNLPLDMQISQKISDWGWLLHSTLLILLSNCWQCCPYKCLNNNLQLWDLWSLMSAFRGHF